MDEETVAHKRQLLAIYEGNLRELEIRTAMYGINTPLSVINEIKHAKHNIEQLRLTLETDAQEVSFDQLLVSIEQLQRYVFEESRRVIIAYQTMIREARNRNTMWILGMGVFGLAMGTGAAAYEKLRTGEFPEKIVFSQLSSLLIYGAPLTFRLIADYRYKKQWSVKFEEQFGFPPDPNLLL